MLYKVSTEQKWTKFCVGSRKNCDIGGRDVRLAASIAVTDDTDATDDVVNADVVVSKLKNNLKEVKSEVDVYVIDDWLSGWLIGLLAGWLVGNNQRQN